MTMVLKNMWFGLVPWHCILLTCLLYERVTSVSVTVTRGRTATLPCSVDFAGNPDAVFWRDPQGETLTHDEQRLTSDTRFSVDRPYHEEWNLKIQNVMTSDEGDYVCRIVSGGTPMDKTITLVVHYPPSLSFVSPDVDVRQGNDVLLRCDGEGRPSPNITWFSYQTGIQTAVGVKGPELKLKAVDINQAATYECEVSNGVSPSTSAKIKVDILFSPEIKTPHDIVSQSKGKTTLLQCFVTANPPSIVTWEKDGHPIVEQPSKYGLMQWEVKLYTLSHGLSVSDLHESDYGAYKCTARNSYGNHSAFVHLQEWRTGEVRVITSPMDSVTHIGSNVRINCTVEDMTSKDSLVWWRQVASSGEWHRLFVSHPISADDKAVVMDSSKYDIEGHYNLLVKSIGYSDSGMYMCEIVGNKNLTATVTVIGGPLECSNGETPVPEGSYATLTCSLQFSGPPLTWDVEWVHGERKLSSVKEDNSNVLKRTLSFPAYVSDMGVYKCAVTSQAPVFTAYCQTQLVVTDPIPTTTIYLPINGSSIPPEPSAGPSTGVKSDNQSLMIGLIIVAIFSIVLLIMLISSNIYYREQLKRYRENSANKPTQPPPPAPSVARYRKNGSVSVERDHLTAPENDPEPV